MEAIMDEASYLHGVGRIIGNLHSLELLLRVFLCEANREIIMFPTSSGIHVPETHLTNYMSLRKLIQKYNLNLTLAERKFFVDTDVVTVRDALAHGRLTSLSPSLPLTLHKFGLPVDGRVLVEIAETISTEWLESKRELLREQMEKVLRCAKERGFKSLG